MSRFFNPALAGLEQYVPGEQSAGQKYIKLNTNELPYPPSPAAAECAAGEAARLNLYSDPDARLLREPLAEYLGVGPGNVLVSNGSDEALAFIFQGLCSRGVAFADLTYGFYPVLSRLYGLEAEIIPLRDDLSIDIWDYAATERAVVIANPNSPTGLALDRGDIEALLRQNPGRLVVVDEAYVAFGGESAAPLLAEYDNLVVVGTFSKAFGLAGARLGYAAAGQAIIEDLTRVKFSFNPYSVNRMTLAAGAAALADRDYYADCISRVAASRTTLLASLRAMGFTCPESRANFIFAAHPRIAAPEIYGQLRRRGILVRMLSHPRAENFLRMTVGSGGDTQALISALDDIVSRAP
jgi:histidinol-phosphate aminotransferase